MSSFDLIIAAGGGFASFLYGVRELLHVCPSDSYAEVAVASVAVVVADVTLIPGNRSCSARLDSGSNRAVARFMRALFCATNPVFVCSALGYIINI